MSKTFGKNSNKQKTEYLSKPLRELATDWYRKFRQDTFSSTRTKIILFHTLSVVAVILVTAGLIEYTQRVSLQAIVDSFNSMITGGQTGSDIFDRTNAHVETIQRIVFVSIVIASALTGWFISRLTLRPFKESLDLQRRFIASVAHELRTPLAVLKTQNEVAKLDVEESSAVAKILDDNIEEIDHITEIFNNLLLFNRVDTLESISFDEVDLSKLLRSMIDRLEMLAHRRGVRLVYSEQGVPKVYGNATALEQAFFNITKNALNYSTYGGEVQIACSGKEHEISVSISDDGSGIAKKDLPHIFEPFYRATKGKEIGRGTGLGLAIVFEIVKLHGGKIYVESAVESGTCFEVTLPRKHRTLSKQMPSDRITYDFTSRERP